MNTLRTNTSLHFMLAIAVSFILSVSLATAASMTGMMPDARVDPQKSFFSMPHASHLRSAAMTAAASEGKRGTSGNQTNGTQQRVRP